VGLILDLAVVILGLLVIGSLALLAWTLAVSSVRAVRAERVRVAAARRSVAEAEGRVGTAAAEAAGVLADLEERTSPQRSRTRLETDPHR
jgi:hypothetical protein